MGNNMERLGEPVAPLGSGDAMSASPGMSRLARSSAIPGAMAKAGPEPAHSGCPWKVGSAVLRSRESP